MSPIALAALLCLAAGVVLGLLGGGGSILAVPVLVYAAGLEPRSAIATSLLVVGASSAVAAVAHARAGSVDLRAGLSLGLATMAGAYVGGRLARFVPGSVLLAAFTAMMVVTAIFMMRRRSSQEDASGGGFVIVPALVLLCGLPMRRAIGTSLVVIAMSSVAAFAGAAGGTSIDLTIVLVAAGAASVGSLLGVAVSKRLPANALRFSFAWFIMAVSGFMVAKQLPAGTVDQLRAVSSHLGAAFVGAALVGALWLLSHLRRPTPTDHRATPVHSS